MKRSSTIALLCALALVLGFLETMIPVPIAIPGFKLGLANAAILLALYRLDLKDAATVAFVKLLASTFLFGSPVMLAYSAAGTLLSFLSLALLKRLKAQLVFTSMVGAIFHNVGQVLVACLFLHSVSALWLLAPLSLAACCTGFAIGAATQAALNAMRQSSVNARPLVSLDCLPIEPGKLIALVGPEGAGKTSALLQACGLDDTNPSAPAPLQGKAGFLFKNPQNQILANRIQDDIAFGLEYRGISPSAMKEKIDTALEEAGLSGWQEAPTATLSLYQQRQVALAGLFALDFPVLLLDEPCAALDESDAWHMREIIQKATERDICVVAATQDALLASQADSTFLLSHGELTPAPRTPSNPERELECMQSNGRQNNSTKERARREVPMKTVGFAGLYREGKSLCHRLHPSFKIIAACAFIALGFCAVSPYALGALALGTALALAASRPQPTLLLKACRPAIPLLVFIVLFDIFVSGPQLAAQSAVRLACVVCISAVLMYTTSPTQLCDGIERIVSPGAQSSPRAARFALNMQLSFRFVPVLFEELQALTNQEEADRSEGSKRSVRQALTSFIPLISRLFESTMQRCIQVCAALENRTENLESCSKTRFRSYDFLRTRE